MNFLQLAQRLRQECGIAGTGPQSVINQSNEARRLVDYVADAWVEIQKLHDAWLFMRAEWTSDIAANAAQITLADAGIADTFKKWDTETLRCFRTSIGSADDMWLVEWDWPVFRDTYRFGQQVPGRPVVFAVKPADKSLQLGPAADVAYTVYGEYWKRPVRLALDADVPAVPDDHHMTIVYKAMEYYGLYESASEVLERGRRGYGAGLTSLEREYLPDICIGGTLA